MRRKRGGPAVYLTGGPYGHHREPEGDPLDPYVTMPKGNDRMWRVTLSNRGRVQSGTLTAYRLLALLEGIKARYPKAKKSPPPKMPMLVRSRIAGPIIATVHALDGPVASVATKQ